MNTCITVALCDNHYHIFHDSFSKARFFNLPKHQKGRQTCSKTNCYADATSWMIIELKDLYPESVNIGSRAEMRDG